LKDPELGERLEVNGSDMPDVEKARFAIAKGAQRPSPTIRDKFEAAMADETVDPLTRSLLRWFSDVEADSASRLVFFDVNRGVAFRARHQFVIPDGLFVDSEREPAFGAFEH
jgi:hypothetical protein